MPVIDRKPTGRDDDEHHSKLINRHHKNNANNDASPVFAYIPIGSTVVVQQDGGLWTHGTIVGKGDHNHHDRSYIIRVTTTGRRITHNRQHIRPTSITADEHIC